MNPNDINEKLVDFAAFSLEIDKARKRQPYEIDLICDYLMAVRTDYRNFGYSEDGFFKGKVVEAIDMAMPVICLFIEETEKTKSAIVAAYAAANTRQNEQMVRFKFWQGVAFALACITVLYCVIRTYTWLSPFLPDLVNWVDSAL